MKVMIIGGGEVGSELAQRLSEKDQDIVLIDKDKDKLKVLNVKFDIMTVHGNGASIKTLEDAGIKETDLLIAVTQIDEVNIMACMIAKKIGVKTTVARIRNPEYEDGSQVLSNEQLGIDIIINPEKVAAQEITQLIKIPHIHEIEYFANGKVSMISLDALNHSKIVNKKIRDLPLPKSCIIAAITRTNNQVIIPRGEDKIFPGDRLYIMGKHNLINEIDWLLRKQRPNQSIVIFGGGMIGLQVAKLLEQDKKNGYELKIIEKDLEKCKEIASQLTKTLIINGDVTDVNLLKEEILEADLTVSVTGDDEVNLLATLLSKSLAIKKTISEIIKPDYHLVFNKTGINCTISPRLTTVNEILKLIRKGDIVSLTILEEEEAEIIELIVPENALIVGKTIAEAKIPKGINITFLMRGNSIIIPGGKTTIESNDRLVIFLKNEMISYIDHYISRTASNSFSGQEKRLNVLSN